MLVYESAAIAAAHASDPAIFDALLVTAASGTTDVTFTPQQGSAEIALTGVRLRTILPVRTRLITVISGGTTPTVIGLRSPVEAPHFNSAVAVTKHDTDPNVFDALYITAPGTLTIEPLQGSQFQIAAGLVTSFILPIRTRKILATGSTATAIGLRF